MGVWSNMPFCDDVILDAVGGCTLPKNIEEITLSAILSGFDPTCWDVNAYHIAWALLETLGYDIKPFTDTDETIKAIKTINNKKISHNDFDTILHESTGFKVSLCTLPIPTRKNLIKVCLLAMYKWAYTDGYDFISEFDGYDEDEDVLRNKLDKFKARLDALVAKINSNPYSVDNSDIKVLDEMYSFDNWADGFLLHEADISNEVRFTYDLLMHFVKNRYTFDKKDFSNLENYGAKNIDNFKWTTTSATPLTLNPEVWTKIISEHENYSAIGFHEVFKKVFNKGLILTNLVTTVEFNGLLEVIDSNTLDTLYNNNETKCTLNGKSISFARLGLLYDISQKAFLEDINPLLDCQNKIKFHIDAYKDSDEVRNTIPNIKAVHPSKFFSVLYPQGLYIKKQVKPRRVVNDIRGYDVEVREQMYILADVATGETLKEFKRNLYGESATSEPEFKDIVFLKDEVWIISQYIKVYGKKPIAAEVNNKHENKVSNVDNKPGIKIKIVNRKKVDNKYVYAISDGTATKVVKGDALKAAIKAGKINCLNATLTSDNRLIITD